MAKSRVTTNPMYRGGAGGYSFYVRGGEQVIRQRRNNSNYGSTASRTRAQMVRRVKWGNLVNQFRAMKSWQPKAYDIKSPGQTDYNIFMKLNINRAAVALTKEMSESGCCVVDAYQVSRGSIPPIDLQWDATPHNYITSIVLTEAISSTTTIGDLATDIIANNPQFQDKDNLAFISFQNWEEPRVEWPYARTTYAEITLDKSSTVLVQDIPDIGINLSKSTGNYLAIAPFASMEVGCVVIHTRKDAQQLFVSSQEVVLNNDTLVQKYTGTEWTEQCILTYGLDGSVPLDPNFKPGTIEKVTANGAVVSNAEILNGSQVIRVYGSSLYGQGYRLVHDSVDLTPQSSTDEYDEYTIATAGSYVIYVDGQRFLSFSVQGPFMPAEMSGRVRAVIVDGGGNQKPGTMLDIDDGCLEYPYQIDSQYWLISVFLYAKDGETISSDDIQIVGDATATYSWSGSNHYMFISITPAEDTAPVSLKYKGFTFFSGNYTD